MKTLSLYQASKAALYKAHELARGAKSKRAANKQWDAMFAVVNQIGSHVTTDWNAACPATIVAEHSLEAALESLIKSLDSNIKRQAEELAALV